MKTSEKKLLDEQLGEYVSAVRMLDDALHQAGEAMRELQRARAALRDRIGGGRFGETECLGDPEPRLTRMPSELARCGLMPHEPGGSPPETTLLEDAERWARDVRRLSFRKE